MYTKIQLEAAGQCMIAYYVSHGHHKRRQVDMAMDTVPEIDRAAKIKDKTMSLIRMLLKECANEFVHS